MTTEHIPRMNVTLSILPSRTSPAPDSQVCGVETNPRDLYSMEQRPFLYKLTTRSKRPRIWRPRETEDTRFPPPNRTRTEPLSPFDLQLPSQTTILQNQSTPANATSTVQAIGQGGVSADQKAITPSSIGTQSSAHRASRARRSAPASAPPLLRTLLSSEQVVQSGVA